MSGEGFVVREPLSIRLFARGSRARLQWPYGIARTVESLAAAELCAWQGCEGCLIYFAIDARRKLLVLTCFIS